jgi:hypothetical protein
MNGTEIAIDLALGVLIILLVWSWLRRDREP